MTGPLHRPWQGLAQPRVAVRPGSISGWVSASGWQSLTYWKWLVIVATFVMRFMGRWLRAGGSPLAALVCCLCHCQCGALPGCAPHSLLAGLQPAVTAAAGARRARLADGAGHYLGKPASAFFA